MRGQPPSSGWRREEENAQGRERRRYPRAAVNTCVTLALGPDEIGVFRVIDLSAGGALLEGRCPVAVGKRLAARLHVSAFEVTAVAVLVRAEAGEHEPVFALHFESMLPAARTCVQALVMGAREQNGVKLTPLPPKARRQGSFVRFCEETEQSATGERNNP